MKSLILAVMVVAILGIPVLAHQIQPAPETDLISRIFSPSSSIQDRGPIYVETLNHLNSSEKGLIWEPYNTASALLFAVVAIYWLIKIRGQPKTMFFRISMVILLIGSIGGTLYHGTRASSWFLMMDVMPILILVIYSVIWVFSRLMQKTWLAWLLALLGFAATMGFYRLLRYYGLTPYGPSMGYLMIAVYVVIPYVIYMLRTKRKAVVYLILTALFFFMAYGFRSIDFRVDLPMGSHFLWHTFGAFASATLITYLWRTRLVDCQRKPVSRPTQQGLAHT